MAMVLQQTLRGLCGKGGWCYAVFWKLKRRNRMVLTWEDGYYEYSTPSTTPSVQLSNGNAIGGNSLNQGLCGPGVEDQIGVAVAKMSYHVYSLGEGIIGRVAFTQKHQWVFGSTNRNESSAVGRSSSRSVVEKYPAGWTNQFAAGIKTIAVISVAQGVVQLGSVQTIMEDLNLVAQIRAMFSTLQSVPGAFLSDYVPDSQSGKTPTSQPYTFPVVVPTPAAPNMVGAYPSQVGMGGIPSIGKFGSAMGSTYAVPHSQIPLSAFDLVMQNRTSQQPQQNKVSNIGYSTPTVCSTAFPGTLPSRDFWDFNRLGQHETGTTAGQSLHTGLYEKPLHDIYEKARVNNFYRLPQGLHVTQHQPACLGTVQLISEEKSRFEDAVPSMSEGIPVPVIGSNALDSGFPTSCSDMVNGSGMELASELSTSYQGILRSDSSWSAQIVGDDLHALGSFDSSTLAPRSEFEECRGWDISEVLMPMKADKSNDSNEDVDCFFALLPKDSGALSNGSSTRANLPTGDGMSEVMPSIYINDQENGSSNKELYVPSHLTPLAPEAASVIELPRDVESAIALASEGSHLEGVVVASKSEQDPDPSSAHSAANPVELASNIKNVVSQCVNPGKVLPTENPSFYKVESRGHALVSHGWVGENLKNEVEDLALPRKREEIKAGRKRARPGETGRPRPKDRQQIQDRVKELREIVPNAEKCSIDTLLEKTIKHLHFLQRVMQHSGKWKKIDEPKENSNKMWTEIKLENGASWALELDGNGRDRCPIIVENLGQPGQMLVEMLCEEKGLFLEIAASIRSLGLVILKGLMETRNDKIWARFVVESSRDVHRFDVVWSLTRLLQPNSLGEVARQGIPTADDWVILQEFHMPQQQHAFWMGISSRLQSIAQPGVQGSVPNSAARF